VADPPDPRIFEVNNPEEFFQFMAQQEAEAIAHTLDEQWAIGWGTYVLRVVDGLWIFGKIFTEAQFLEVEQFDEAELDEEGQYELQHLRDMHERGYRYGQWFSEVVPNGEYGSSHVVNLWEISYPDFREAQARGWEVPPELAFKVGSEVGDALQRREKG
jgi:hypothetical protein